NLFERHSQLPGQISLLRLSLWQKLMQRRVQSSDRGRQSLQLFENADKILPLVGQQLAQRRFSLLERLSKDHFPHRVNAIPLEKHMFGSRQTDTFRTKRHRGGYLVRRIGICSNLKFPDLVGPTHQRSKPLKSLTLFRVQLLLYEHLDYL